MHVRIILQQQAVSQRRKLPCMLAALDATPCQHGDAACAVRR